MKSKLALTLLFCFFFSILYSQNKPLESITETDLKAHLEFISSDLMQGRDFGTTIPGLEITAEYLKSQCLRIGLKPIKQGRYEQSIEIIHVNKSAPNTFIQILSDNKEIVIPSDSIVDYFGSGNDDNFNGDIVYAGYGYSNSQTGYDDFENIDVRDKYVVVLTRNKELALDKKPINLLMEFEKHDVIFKNGAKGIIKIFDPLFPNPKGFEMMKKYKSSGRFMLDLDNGKNRQILFVNESTANIILSSSGKTIGDLQKEIQLTGTPNSFQLTDLEIEIHVNKTRKRVKAENVIGILEGSDPNLKNEYIILTAHYDHLGVNANGDVYNGADDNGSGTSALIEIAEAFSLSKEKPKRSIIFVWTTAEEHGLFGSKYYTENPIVPLEKTIACINLDMVGRSRDSKKGEENQGILASENEIFITSGKLSSELIKLTNNICVENGLLPRDDRSTSSLKRSDHYPFFEKGIPIVGISTGMHEDYHKVSDELDKIDYAKMKKVTQLAFQLTNQLANKEVRISIDNPDSN